MYTIYHENNFHANLNYIIGKPMPNKAGHW